MYYWNKDNFEGLLQLAESFEAQDQLQPLAAYCRFRELGLRRDAFNALEQYLDAARSFERATARSAAVQILEANARTKGVHQFLTQPLINRFLLPTLTAWMHEDGNANVPVRWLGILGHDRDLLAKALAMCPEDTPVRKRLIDYALGDVEYATHHLDESRFIGSVEGAISALERAKHLIAHAPNQEGLAQLAAELMHFDRLIEDWKAYLEDRVGSFPEWCALRGRNYRYPIKVYYG